MTDPAPRSPFRALCPECCLVWVVCYLPLPIGAAAQAMLAAKCPNQCAASPKMLSQGQWPVNIIGLATFIARGRYRQGDEFALHADLDARLTRAGIEFEREVRLSPGNRIDFLFPNGVGIECKARARKRDTYRQLERYADEPRITGLILVTATPVGLPQHINGKPLFYIPLGRTSL